MFSRIAALSELSRPEMDMFIRKECSYLARQLPNLSEAISGPRAMTPWKQRCSYGDGGVLVDCCIQEACCSLGQAHDTCIRSALGSLVGL
jgi:hypothetical protein